MPRKPRPEKKCPSVNPSPNSISLRQGKIARWNDPLIAKLNPGVTLRPMPITPVYRSDSSGTTAIFSSYLTKVAPNWTLGAGKALLRHAIEHDGVRLVDVNEQNPDAVDFYRRRGFEQVGRSPVDSDGRPFPLLHFRRAGVPET